MSKLTNNKQTQRRIGRTRRGYALVLFVLLIGVFVGLAALVIDLGFVRLTHRQMQTAADSAALEGLRFRDHFPDEWLDANPELAAEILSPDAAGPLPEAPQTLDDAEWQDWRERVARYMASRRVRQSFGDAESIETTDDGNALEVRLRRSVGNSDTTGDALPSFFARGSVPPGFAVSYSGIAAVGDVTSGGGSANPVLGRAIAVGRPNNMLSVRGYAPFAVKLETWNSLPPGDSEPVNEESLAQSPDAEFLHIGDSVPSGGSLSAGEWYIPIFKEIGQQRMVVGFGFGTVVGDEVSRDASPFIARENATASFKALPQVVPPEVLADVLEASKDVLFPLVCPVLVQQHYIDSTPD